MTHDVGWHLAVPQYLAAPLAQRVSQCRNQFRVPHPLSQIQLDDACVDRPTPDGFTCKDQRDFGACLQPFMTNPAPDWPAGYCQKTCQRCTCDKQARDGPGMRVDRCSASAAVRQLLRCANPALSHATWSTAQPTPRTLWHLCTRASPMSLSHSLGHVSRTRLSTSSLIFPQVSCGLVTMPDLEAQNGIVHGIARVLYPPPTFPKVAPGVTPPINPSGETWSSGV